MLYFIYQNIRLWKYEEGYFLGTLFLGGLISLSLGNVDVNAASFEQFREDVESGNGFIYNPELDGIMSHERSLEIVELIEEQQEILNTEEVTEEM